LRCTNRGLRANEFEYGISGSWHGERSVHLVNLVLKNTRVSIPSIFSWLYFKAWTCGGRKKAQIESHVTNFGGEGYRHSMG
jgi:hypothetical protein